MQVFCRRMHRHALDLRKEAMLKQKGRMIKSVDNCCQLSTLSFFIEIQPTAINGGSDNI